MTHKELCNQLITSLNDLLKNMAAGQYIRVSSLTMDIVQLIQELRGSYAEDMKAKDDQIASLKEMLAHVGANDTNNVEGKDNGSN